MPGANGLIPPPLLLVVVVDGIKSAAFRGLGSGEDNAHTALAFIGRKQIKGPSILMQESDGPVIGDITIESSFVLVHFSFPYLWGKK